MRTIKANLPEGVKKRFEKRIGKKVRVVALPKKYKSKSK